MFKRLISVDRPWPNRTNIRIGRLWLAIERNQWDSYGLGFHAMTWRFHRFWLWRWNVAVDLAAHPKGCECDECIPF